MKVLTTQHATLNPLKNVPISVIGYGAQGRAQALCLKDSGLDVTIGARLDGPTAIRAQEDGFEVVSISEAARRGGLIHLLIPDECQKDVYDANIAPHLEQGDCLSFSHGFSIVYQRIRPPDNVDVILVAPKSPGTEERKAFLDGFGVPGLVAVEQNASGRARDRALALAHGLGLTRAGVLECTFRQEVYEDLFGEQAVLCGGTAALVKAGFETLVEAGYPPEMAYFECLHELKLIVDLIYEGGLTHMWDVVSNTAEYGGLTMGKEIIGPEVKKSMKKLLGGIHDGTFAKNWMKEYENGLQELEQLRREESSHPIEVIGKDVRKLFKKRA